jgi:hypothetical protein
MKRWVVSVVIGVVGCMSQTSCVTINIYFPAAAAEKAADKIIDEVTRLEQGSQVPKPATPAPAVPPKQ